MVSDRPAARGTAPACAPLSLADLSAPSAPRRGSFVPRLAIVHNPYSFQAYDLVLEDPAGPPSPGSDRSWASDPSSVGSRSLLFDDAATPRAGVAAPGPPAPPMGPRPHPAAPASPPSLPSPQRCSPGLSPKSAGAMAPRAPPLQWSRYGSAVSHMEALKDLQAFTKQYPVLPPTPPSFEVRVGPPSLAAPAAQPPATPAVHTASASVLPQPPLCRRLGAILLTLGCPAPPPPMP
eukprot:EG_transcript_5428